MWVATTSSLQLARHSNSRCARLLAGHQHLLTRALIGWRPLAAFPLTARRLAPRRRRSDTPQQHSELMDAAPLAGAAGSPPSTPASSPEVPAATAGLEPVKLDLAASSDGDRAVAAAEEKPPFIGPRLDAEDYVWAARCPAGSRCLAAFCAAPLPRRLSAAAACRCRCLTPGAVGCNTDWQACPVCFELYCEPVYTPCHHLFCSVCLLRAQIANSPPRCPMCRASWYAPRNQAVASAAARGWSRARGVPQRQAHACVPCAARRMRTCCQSRRP